LVVLIKKYLFKSPAFCGAFLLKSIADIGVYSIGKQQKKLKKTIKNL